MQVADNICLQQFLNNILVDELLRGYFLLALLQASPQYLTNCLHLPLLFLAQGHPLPYFNCNFICGTLQLQEESMQVQTQNNKSTPLLISKNILIRDSIFKRLDIQNEYSSQDKAKDSQMYQHLERKLETAKREHLAFMQAIDEKIAMITEQTKGEKASLHEKKIDLWELKNQVMQLHEMIEHDEYQQEEEYEEEEAEIIQSHNEGSQQQGQEQENEQEDSNPRDLNE